MTDAPKQIFMDGDIEAGDGHWARCFEAEKPCNEPALKYIREDVAQAMADRERARADAARATLKETQEGQNERLKSHIEWLRGDHEKCNPFLAEDIEALFARAEAAEKAYVEQCDELEAAKKLVSRAVSLIEGDLVGREWKRACADFCRDASAALTNAQEDNQP